MNNTKLHELLGKILTIAEISGAKHIGYIYQKENFMADTTLKLVSV